MLDSLDRLGSVVQCDRLGFIDGKASGRSFGLWVLVREECEGIVHRIFRFSSVAVLFGGGGGLVERKQWRKEGVTM